jgi:hypothetical protein
MATSDSSASVVPSEVGWQFVPQYYTFVNKHPSRLHCFYTKTSTFTHGTEGEDITPCHGQQEIHAKITSIGFEDCKVFIHSVDAQSSANGGIILQVIGEMSNRGEPWRKFVQTFFLAEQPNGYFVLNDIFRFLKEEAPEGDETSESEAEAVSAEEPTPAPAVPTFEAPQETPSAPTTQTTVVEPPAVEEPTVSLPPAAEPVKVNGTHASEPEASPAPQPPSPLPASQPAAADPPSPSPSPAPAPPPAASAPEPSPAVASEPVQQPPAPVAAAPTPASTSAPGPAPSAAPPVSAAPSAPKTWANLAAANSKKWGAAVATESRGTSEAPASVPGSGAGTPTSSAPRGAPPGQRTEHPAYQAAQSVTTPQCFVKGVLETVSSQALTNTLTQRYGPIKDLEIVRSKACAFLEFATLEAAKKAIIASLHISQGGEGGIRVDIGNGEHQRITVETKKERGERPVSRPRGGPPVNGEGRGGFRGRGGPGGRGRGAAK